MAQITLTVTQETADGIVTKNPVVDIKKINFKKFMGVTKLIKEIIKTVKEDENLSDTFSTMFLEEAPEVEPTAEEKAAKDKEFASKLIASFEVLAEEIPEKALELLSMLSGIKEEDLEEQDFFVFLDVYEAVIEVNNVPELLERVKKSFETTKKAMKLKQLVQSVNQ